MVRASKGASKYCVRLAYSFNNLPPVHLKIYKQDLHKLFQDKIDNLKVTDPESQNSITFDKSFFVSAIQNKQNIKSIYCKWFENVYPEYFI